MSEFQILTGYLADSVAMPALKYFKKKYGSAGLKIEAPFSKSIQWVPTFYLKRSPAELIIVEVSDVLYPVILKTSYPNILNEEAASPIKVYQVCPLESYIADAKQQKVRELRAHGFGLITVSDQGHVTEQFPAAILVNHVADADFQNVVKDLPPDVRGHVSKAFDVYRADAGQGVQLSGQIIEALVHFIAAEAKKRGWLTSYNPSKPAAKIIDDLYNSTAEDLKKQRHCIGGARQLMKDYRNPTSHPTKSKQEAKDKMFVIKGGFMQTLKTIAHLCTAKKELKIRGKVTLA